MNNWIYTTQKEQRAEALKALEKAKELENLKQLKKMKTALGMTIATFENDSDNQFSKEWVLAQLKFYKQVEETQLKTAYIHGAVNVLQKTEITSDQFFINEFKN